MMNHGRFINPGSNGPLDDSHQMMLTKTIVVNGKETIMDIIIECRIERNVEGISDALPMMPLEVLVFATNTTTLNAVVIVLSIIIRPVNVAFASLLSAGNVLQKATNRSFVQNL